LFFVLFVKFGEMVYSRLISKSEEALNSTHTSSSKKLKLSTRFTCDDVPLLAKDTCRNWFYKISCIRDILPRIYVEIALLKCYRFLTTQELLASIISRIGTIIRGLGNPLVACYARLYLVVVANQVLPSVPALSALSPGASAPASGIALSMFQDIMLSFTMVKDACNNADLVQELEKKKVSMKSYHFVLSPVLEWILKYIASSTSKLTSTGPTGASGKEVFQGILQLYRDHSGESLVLKHIIDSFDASYYAHAAMGMITLIKVSEPTCFSTVDLLTALGKQLIIYPPPEEHRLTILNDVWKIVSKSSELPPYVTCTATWLEVVQKYYSEREMIVLLGQFSQRITAAPMEALEPLLPCVESLLNSLIGQSSTFGSAVLTSEHLLKILDVFKGPKKVQLCKVS
jgi:hypothetical protein